MSGTPSDWPIRVDETSAAHVSRHAPWPNGRRPRFWDDLPVRIAATQLHREVGLERACALIAGRFGAERAPSRSALQRYWALLDNAVWPSAPVGAPI